MQPSSRCVGSTSASKASCAASSFPGRALNDPTTTISDMRCSSPAGRSGRWYGVGEGEERRVSSRINHVSVNALDLQESVEFYVDLLGAERIATPNFGLP